MKLKQLTRNEIKNLKINDCVCLKVPFYEQIEFDTDKPISNHTEVYENCKLLYKTNNFLFLQYGNDTKIANLRNDRIYVKNAKSI